MSCYSSSPDGSGSSSGQSPVGPPAARTTSAPPPAPPPPQPATSFKGRRGRRSKASPSQRENKWEPVMISQPHSGNQDQMLDGVVFSDVAAPNFTGPPLVPSCVPTSGMLWSPPHPPSPLFSGPLPGLGSMDSNGYYELLPPLFGQFAFAEPRKVHDEPADVKATVEKEGYISLHLRYDIRVDIAPNQAIRVLNHRKGIILSLSGCATQMAMVHPQGRVLQYNSRIEIQTEDFLSIKNAKMWPRGVSFTANHCALVYLLDQAGARTTTDTFHDLYADSIADNVFLKSCQYADSYSNTTASQNMYYMQNADYWRTDCDLDCWLINDVSIKQTPDGLVSVERKHGREVFTLKTSPNNGKARMQSSFVYFTASMGDEAHIFVKSNERRMHYNGHTFVVRNGGHSAGFDDVGQLRIW